MRIIEIFFFHQKYPEYRLKLITTLPPNKFCALTQHSQWRMFQCYFDGYAPTAIIIIFDRIYDSPSDLATSYTFKFVGISKTCKVNEGEQ